MKKKIIVTIALALVMTLLVSVALVGCENKDENTDNPSTVTVNVVVPDGSPAIAIAKLVSENPTFAGYDINYSIVEGATQISAAILNDTANIAIAPLNLGATMYNKGMGVKLVTTNVQGSLYMVGKNMPAGATTAEKLASLKGKVVYNIGQGATPDLTFKYILDHFGIAYTEGDTAAADVVTLNYVNTGSELIPLLKQGKAEYGIMGEPAVTKANANAGTSTVFDIQALWQESTGSATAGFPQAGVFVKDSLLASEHAAFIEWFVAKLKENDEWAPANAEKVSSALTSAGSTSLAGLTSATINACNLKTVKAADAKTAVNTYLGALYAFNAATVGGKMPDDNFFYAPMPSAVA